MNMYKVKLKFRMIQKGCVFLLYMFFCLASATAEGALTMSGSGTSWILTLSQADFDMDVGFTSVFENDADLSLSISGANKKSWKVTVLQRDDLPEGFILSVKRIDDGQAGLSGGLSYTVIEKNEGDFFYGTAKIDAADVYGQYKLEGWSENTLPGTYSLNVINKVKKR